MKKRKGFGQLIITFAFAYSALLCHFHASELKENGDIYTALLYWFFGLTAVNPKNQYNKAVYISPFSLSSLA